MSYRWWQYVLSTKQIFDVIFIFWNRLALWLDHSKTLRQQDIDEQSTVVLRRKYFFSDNDVDQRDPVQLNLLYIQVNKSLSTISQVNIPFSPSSVSKWNIGWYTSRDLWWSCTIRWFSKSNSIGWLSRIET